MINNNKISKYELITKYEGQEKYNAKSSYKYLVNKLGLLQRKDHRFISGISLVKDAYHNLDVMFITKNKNNSVEISKLKDEISIGLTKKVNTNLNNTLLFYRHNNTSLYKFYGVFKPFYPSSDSLHFVLIDYEFGRLNDNILPNMNNKYMNFVINY